MAVVDRLALFVLKILGVIKMKKRNLAENRRSCAGCKSWENVGGNLGMCLALPLVICVLMTAESSCPNKFIEVGK